MSHGPLEPADGSGPDQPDRGWRTGAGHLDPSDPHLLERLGIVVPDDARELEAERVALFGALPRPWWRRVAGHLLPGRGSARTLTTIALTAMLVAAVALSGSMLGTLAPRSSARSPETIGLAPAPEHTAGVVGGLLPDAGVRIDDTVGMAARDLRPAVLFHPPSELTVAACRSCAASLEALWRQASEYGIGVYVVVPPERVQDATDLVDKATQGAAHVAVDGAGALTAAYAAPDVASAVLVHVDGVVGEVLRDPSAKGRFEQVLSPLRQAGAPPSLRSASSTH